MLFWLLIKTNPNTVVGRQCKSIFHLRSKPCEIKPGNQCKTSFSYFIYSLQKCSIVIKVVEDRVDNLLSKKLCRNQV